MPIRRKAVDAGIVDSAELALLGRVFDQMKTPNQSAESQSRLAARIIANFMAGVVDEAELIALSRQPLDR
ncbi:hypothetical protein DBIPINDM_008160 (plasmid) [Mesorhizobium sp. AR02]|uniref:hypothetical protein n=1 Tax=Mesorhizobium sp. AR02 TaxID=2865837 RepID=UPI00215FB944|nr:hypothetical protein [Mesorhizobium sp. AR02]UVK57559.1 hypothetical protein DBIPINDM_008160 [Mesorhizobium sp. AR02]